MIKRGTCSLACSTDNEGLPGDYRFMSPGFYVAEHLFVNPKIGMLKGRVKTGEKRVWCVSHVHTGKLIIGPAHRIKSPMTAVTIAVELLRLPINWKDENPADNLDANSKTIIQKRIRELIAAETHRLANITDEIFTPENTFPIPQSSYFDDGVYFE